MSATTNVAEHRPAQIHADDVEAFVRGRLFDPKRSVPIIAVTTGPWEDDPWVDPGALAKALGANAEVVVLTTGNATWELAEHLPEKLEVYGGAVRVWWPGLKHDSEPSDHPLFFVRDKTKGRAVSEKIQRMVLPREKVPAPTTQDADGAWARFLRHYRVNDVLIGTVQNVTDFGIFLDLIPHVTGLVHKSQIDVTYVKDPRNWAAVGDQVKARILKIDAAERRIELSIRQAHGAEIRAPLDDSMAVAPSPTSRATTAAQDDDPDEIAQLRDELETIRQDRSQLRRTLSETRKELRSALDRLAHLERGAAPAGSEPAFLEAVRVAYARLLPEDQRVEWPLRRMLVGPEFLERLASLQGIKHEKVIEVCAQVACGIVREVPGRQLHRLRVAERGAGYRNRGRDGASAWRCSLEDGTASARRLHWWSIGGTDGETIEFASVGLHDEYGIPE